MKTHGTESGTSVPGDIAAVSDTLPSRPALVPNLAASNLDNVKRDWRLAESLGLEGHDRHSITHLCKALVAGGYLDPNLPADYVPRHTSRYFSDAFLPPEQTAANIRSYALRTFRGDLDAVTIDGVLAHYFNLPAKQSAPALAAALVRAGLLNPCVEDRPATQDGTSAHRPLRADSNYFNPVIVPPEAYRRNLSCLVHDLCAGNLDQIPKLSALESLLGTSKGNLAELSRCLIAENLISPHVPDGYIPPRASSLYFNSNAVGAAAAQANILTFLKRIAPGDLDAVVRNSTAGSVLRLEKPESTVHLARALIARGIISPVLPVDYLPPRNCFYLNPDIVGPAQFVENMRTVAATLWNADLDRVTTQKANPTALGVSVESPVAFCRRLIENGILSPLLPDDHSLQRLRHPSRYIDPEIVGAHHALRNLRVYLQNTFTGSGEIQKHNFSQLRSAAQLVGSPPTIDSFRKRIEALGWFAPGRMLIPIRLPAAFTREARPATDQKRTASEPSTSYSPRDVDRSLTIKGEAFEQLVGLALAARHPSEQVISQYCLVVEPENRYFGTRVDFKVGSRFIEVKWGRAQENIEASAQKHRAHLPPDAQYEVVCLRANRELGLKHTTFCRLVERLDLRVPLVRLARQLSRDAAGHRGDSLALYRDYFNSLLVEANERDGPERVSFLAEALSELDSTPPDDCASWLLQHTRFAFQPLHAHFHYDGTLYRGRINIPQLTREDPARYQTLHLLGNVAFTDVLDRDVAVVLEVSGLIRRVEESLLSPAQRHAAPVFRLNDGRTLSTHPGAATQTVRSLEQLRDELAVPQDVHQFALSYIGWFGDRC